VNTILPPPPPPAIDVSKLPPPPAPIKLVTPPSITPPETKR
jgi:hypothetical protein